jgi:hypothetical protein
MELGADESSRIIYTRDTSKLQIRKRRRHGYNRLCDNCQSIFEGELIYHIDEDCPQELVEISHAPPYQLYNTEKVAVVSLLQHDCHLCFLQGRRLLQNGAALKDAFWIRYLFELGEIATDAFTLRFSYSQTPASVPAFSSKVDSFSQIFHLSPTVVGDDYRWGASTYSWSSSRLLAKYKPVQRESLQQVVHMYEWMASIERPSIESDHSFELKSKKLQLPAPASSTQSNPTWRTGRLWLEHCITSHFLCHGSTPLSKRLPTRLIEILRLSPLIVRIVQGGMLPSYTEYTTLSYCWV